MTRFTAAVALAAVVLTPFGLHTAHDPSAGVQAGRSEASPVRVDLDPVVHVHGADSEQAETLDDALARFRGAGLELPELDVHFSDDGADCLGHDGLFDPDTSPWRITICSGAAFVPTHELAHAWEAAHLDDADRDHYAEVRGFETWNGRHVPWGERAIEDAAFVIQQNLMAGEHATSDRWLDRAAAFELLTGRRSPVLD